MTNNSSGVSDVIVEKFVVEISDIIIEELATRGVSDRGVSYVIIEGL